MTRFQGWERIALEKGMTTRRLTLLAGANFLASISGKMNRLTSHPHAKSLKLRSCQSATKVNTIKVLKTTLRAPPSGI